MGKEYMHVRNNKTGKVEMVEVNRANRGINPESSSGTIKDGPFSRLADRMISKKKGK